MHEESRRSGARRDESEGDRTARSSGIMHLSAVRFATIPFLSVFLREVRVFQRRTIGSEDDRASVQVLPLYRRSGYNRIRLAFLGT